MVSQSKDSDSEILKSYGTQSRQRQYEETGGTTQKSGTAGLKETQAKNGEITGRFHDTGLQAGVARFRYGKC